MLPIYRVSAAILLGAMLAGCGATAKTPIGAPVIAAASAAKAYAAANAANAADVEKLIGDFKAVSGYDEMAMAKRSGLIAKLGDSDDDKALAFLQAEYETLSVAPPAVRDAYEDRLIEGLDALDTYDEDLDDAILAAGPGEAGSIQAMNYEYAATRHRRRKGIVHWLTSPFRWVGRGLGRLFGVKKKKRRKRRTPPNYPSYPTDPGNGYGNGYEYPSRRY